MRGFILFKYIDTASAFPLFYSSNNKYRDKKTINLNSQPVSPFAAISEIPFNQVF